MSTINAVILGILQGLTEFLPVSSSGHLAIGKHILNFETPNMLFDVMLHVATLLVVLIYFRRRVFLIIKAFFGIVGDIKIHYEHTAHYRCHLDTERRPES